MRQGFHVRSYAFNSQARKFVLIKLLIFKVSLEFLAPNWRFYFYISRSFCFSNFQIKIFYIFQNHLNIAVMTILIIFRQLKKQIRVDIIYFSFTNVTHIVLSPGTHRDLFAPFDKKALTQPLNSLPWRNQFFLCQLECVQGSLVSWAIQ